MPFPSSLVAVREHGDREHPYWYPSLDDAGHLVCEPGESVLASGIGAVRLLETRPPGMPRCGVHFTERRMIWMTDDFDRGGGYVGLGAVGLGVAVTANLVSRKRAAARRVGRTLVGQVRYEWIAAVSSYSPPDRQKAHAILYTGTADGLRQVGVAMADLMTPAFCHWLGCAVAHHRLSMGLSLTQEDRTILEVAARAELDASTPPGEVVVKTPACSEDAVAAAYSRAVS